MYNEESTSPVWSYHTEITTDIWWFQPSIHCICKGRSLCECMFMELPPTYMYLETVSRSRHREKSQVEAETSWVGRDLTSHVVQLSSSIWKLYLHREIFLFKRFHFPGIDLRMSKKHLPPGSSAEAPESTRLLHSLSLKLGSRYHFPCVCFFYYWPLTEMAIIDVI